MDISDELNALDGSFGIPSDRLSKHFVKWQVTQLIRLCLAADLGVPQTTEKEKKLNPGSFTTKTALIRWLRLNWTQCREFEHIMEKKNVKQFSKEPLEIEEQKAARDARFRFHELYEPEKGFKIPVQDEVREAEGGKGISGGGGNGYEEDGKPKDSGEVSSGDGDDEEDANSGQRKATDSKDSTEKKKDTQ